MHVTTILAENAARRHARQLRRRLMRTSHRMAAITTLAPLLGLYCSASAALTAFGAMSGSKEQILFAVLLRFAHALEFTAFGLAIGLLAWWTRDMLRSQAASLKIEEEAAGGLLRSW